MQGTKNGENKAKRTAGASSLDKSEILSRIAWARHVLALSAGLACGAFGLTGFLGFVIFAATNVLVVLGYYSFILGVDADEHGGHGQFTSEAMMPALGIFIV